MSNQLLYATALGLILIVTIDLYYSQKYIRKRDWLRPWRSPTIRLDAPFLASATISRDLLPRFTPYVDSTARISIVGADGTYATSANGKSWIKGLEKWLNAGAEIKYILINPTGESKNIYTDLDKCNRNFHFAIFNPEQCTSDYIQKFSRFSTFHPVLLTGKQGSAMWIENYHPAGSSVAYEIEYYSPRRMDEVAVLQFERHSNQFSELWDASNPVNSRANDIDKYDRIND